MEAFLNLIVKSERTPKPRPVLPLLSALLRNMAHPAGWGQENLKGETEGTSPDNEMSIVQFADICGIKTLLTGDAGVRALAEARQAATDLRIVVSPLDWFSSSPSRFSQESFFRCT